MLFRSSKPANGNTSQAPDNETPSATVAVMAKIQIKSHARPLGVRELFGLATIKLPSLLKTVIHHLCVTQPYVTQPYVT